jgi:hypothetical protein
LILPKKSNLILTYKKRNKNLENLSNLTMTIKSGARSGGARLNESSDSNFSIHLVPYQENHKSTLSNQNDKHLTSLLSLPPDLL